jgi:hypothetical protein
VTAVGFLFFVFDQENDFLSRFADSGTSRLRQLQQLPADFSIAPEKLRVVVP